MASRFRPSSTLVAAVLTTALLGAGDAQSSNDACDLKLVSVGGSKLNVVKAVKAVTGLGLRDAKSLVDSAPSTILEAAASSAASAGETQLEQAGAEAEVDCGATSGSSESGSGSSSNAEPCDVILSSVGGAKLNVVKAVKSVTGLGLKDAKSLVDSAPSTILADQSASDAAAARGTLEGAGATVTLECTAPSSGSSPGGTSGAESSGSGATCDLKLVSVGGSKLNVVKAVKALTGLGLKEAKSLVDSAPSRILDDTTSAAATAGESYLTSAGATAEVDCGGSSASRGSSRSRGTAASEPCAVELVEVGGRKVSVIKAVRALTGLGLKDAKTLVDSAPSTVLEGQSAVDAASAERRLESAGAKVSLECGNGASSDGSSSGSAASGNSCALLLDTVGGSKLNVVKVVKSLTGLGLKDAKALVDSAPSTVLSGRSASEATNGKSVLEQAGASARIQCD